MKSAFYPIRSTCLLCFWPYTGYIIPLEIYCNIGDFPEIHLVCRMPLLPSSCPSSSPLLSLSHSFSFPLTAPLGSDKNLNPPNTVSLGLVVTCSLCRLSSGLGTGPHTWCSGCIGLGEKGALKVKSGRVKATQKEKSWRLEKVKVKSSHQCQRAHRQKWESEKGLE